MRAPIDVVTWDETLERIAAWAASRESRYVCICNVHSAVTAARDPAYYRVIAEADLVTPDGMPIAWMMRRLGIRRQERISGPDVMWRYCALAQSQAEPVYFLGGSPATLERLIARTREAFPQLRIAGAHSPPFRPLTDSENAQIARDINAADAGVVFVGLGCPRQEIWMAANRGRINAVMIGVGAAFDYHAGTLKRAPLWMQQRGLEWLHRLACEPRRLWKRYLVTNTLFVIGALRQLCSSKPVGR